MSVGCGGDYIPIIIFWNCSLSNSAVFERCLSEILKSQCRYTKLYPIHKTQKLPQGDFTKGKNKEPLKKNLQRKVFVVLQRTLTLPFSVMMSKSSRVRWMSHMSFMPCWNSAKSRPTHTHTHTQTHTHTRTHTHTHAHTHTHTHTSSLTHPPTLSLSLSLTQSLSLSHAHAHTNTHTSTAVLVHVQVDSVNLGLGVGVGVGGGVGVSVGVGVHVVLILK